jgi:sec-independent protein translocase protein TatB
MFDFGIGSSELILIAVVALIVIGPKDLPKVLRTIGQFTTKMRSLAREFQRHLDEATRETGLDEVKKDVNKMTNFTVTDLDKTGSDIKKAIEDTAPRPAPKPGTGAGNGTRPEAPAEPAGSAAGEQPEKPEKSQKTATTAAPAVAADQPAAPGDAGKAAG